MTDSSGSNPFGDIEPVPFDSVNKKLGEPGSFFETDVVDVRGVAMRVYKNAPPSLRELYDLGRMWGDREFFVYGDERLTFNVFHKAVVQLASALKDRFGIEKGDRVVLAMRNYPEWAISFWALANIGAVAVPLNAWWQGPELEFGVRDSGATLAIVDVERLERLAEHLPALKLSAVIATRTSRDILEDAVLWDDVVAAPDAYDSLPDADMPIVDLQPDDPATIFYTSGTTGQPKGALGTQRNLLTNVLNAVFCRYRAFVRRGEEPPSLFEAPQSVMLASIPFFHVTGCFSLLVPSYATGAKLVSMHHWDAGEALRLIEAEQVTGFGGVPSIVWQVLEHPDFGKYDLSSVDSVSYGGAPSAPELVARIEEAFPQAQPTSGYGLTETSAVTTMNVGEDYLRKPDSAGVPPVVVEVKIVGVDGEALPVGGIGEIWVKGPNVVSGYWQNPEETEKTFTDGWLHTGDIGRVDDEGFVYILDRAKDMLIRGGENIYCIEVEDALYAHPAVMDAAVVGIPHKVLGEEVGAVVQLAPGQEVTMADLQGFVGECLAEFKVPVYIELQREPLPRNANGKILKHHLREGMARKVRG